MPSRRAVLSLLAAVPLAGCSAISGKRDDSSEPTRTVRAVGDVRFDPDAAVTLTDSVADAEAVVLPASDEHDDVALEALDRGTPVVVAGADAPRHLHRICDRDGRRYGLPGEAWTTADRVGAVVPAGERLDVQSLQPTRGSDRVDHLEWAVGEVIDGELPAFSVADPPRPDDGVELGRVRTRGRVEVGDYDRWDRVTLLPDRTRAVVETVATVEAAQASFPERYRVDEVSIRTGFDGVTGLATGPTSTTTHVLSVEEVVSEDRTRVTHTFTPESEETRRATTVAARTVVTLSDLASTFGYVGNARFRWRIDGPLREEPWVAHTPGRAVWREFGPS